MRDTMFVRRRASGIAGKSESAIQAVRILILDGKLNIEDGLTLTEMLHDIRSQALEIHVKESSK